MTFAQLIRERQEEIIRRWVERVVRATPDGQVDARRRARAVEVLRKVADNLPTYTAQAVREPALFPPAAQDVSMPLVGDSRRVVRDYVLLRDAVFDVAEEVGVRPAFGELRILLDAIAAEIISDAISLAEAERDLFFRTIPDMLCIVTFEGWFLRVNPSFHQVLGWTAEELMARPVWAFIHPDDLDRTQAEVQAIASGKPTVRFENRYLRKDGGYRLLSWAASPVVEKGFMYAVARDATELREQELERERALSTLRHTAEFRERFVGIVAHDLRTPLASIATGAQLLQRMDGVPERAARIARRISDTASRTSRIIGDLMDFTRVRLGSGIPVERAPADLGAIVRQVVDEADSVYPGRSVQIVTDGPFPGRWDADRLAQLAGNLLKNALDYSPSDSPVEVVLGSEDGAVRLEIRNRNLGDPIPSERIHELFEPFYKGTERKTKREGLGLGLYIADQIATAHGGDIEVSSDETGTRFVVRLPPN